MEFEEMNQRAYRREDPPNDLTPAERMIYLALSLLYELHFCGRRGYRLRNGSNRILSSTGSRKPSGCAARRP